MSTLKLPKGVTSHRNKLRIAFRPHGFKNQVKRSLFLPITRSNIKIAEMKLNAIKHDIMLGTFTFDKHFPNDPFSETKHTTVAQIAKKYIHLDAIKRGLKPSTALERKRHTDALVSTVGEQALSGITPDAAEKLQDVLLKKYTPSTVNGIWKSLKSATKKATIRGDLVEDPLSLVGLIPVKRKVKDIDVFSMAHYQKIVDSIQCEAHRNAVIILFWTGMRPGELAAAEKSDYASPYLSINKTKSKQGEILAPKTISSTRKILLTHKAIDAIERQIALYPQLPEICTTSNGLPLPRNEIMPQETWAKTLKRAKVPYLSIYHARHSFISWMLSAGEDPFRVAKHVGHKNVEMVMKVYGKYIRKEEEKWALDDPNVLEQCPKPYA